MNHITGHQLINALEWRYATKAFEVTRKIADETWAALERCLVLAPSSFGLQPYRFLVITDPQVRERLLPHAWGQRQVVDCSHFVVFAARTQLAPEHIDALIQRTVELRGVAPETLQSYREMMLGALVKGSKSQTVPQWAERQAYLALGTLLAGAALLGVDACPMEGFVPDKFDAILGLKDSGFRAVVCCALGYRSAADRHASLKKVRFPNSELIRRI